MKERPVIFGAGSMRSILAEPTRKTQTRRVVKPVRGYEHNNICRPDMAADDWAVWWHGESERVGCLQSCPYGVPGDRLWCREAWITKFPEATAEHVIYRASDDGHAIEHLVSWRSPIFMPRWASRLTLEVTAVRVERLQDISEADAIAEGVRATMDGDPDKKPFGPLALMTFARGWDALNELRGYPWISNPWVWCISFRRLDQTARATA